MDMKNNLSIESSYYKSYYNHKMNKNSYVVRSNVTIKESELITKYKFKRHNKLMKMKR